MKYVIRIAERKDAEAVHDIYGHYVNHTTTTFCTVNPSVSDYVQKIETTEKMYPFLVAEWDGKVIGFTYGAQFRAHGAYLWNVESTICLAPDTPRRCGIGSALYGRMLEMLKEQGFLSVYGVVVETNEPSLALHRSLGFRPAAHFAQMGYKHGAWLGVFWMQKQIGSVDGEPTPPIPFAEYRREVVGSWQYTVPTPGI